MRRDDTDPTNCPRISLSCVDIASAGPLSQKGHTQRSLGCTAQHGTVRTWSPCAAAAVEGPEGLEAASCALRAVASEPRAASRVADGTPASGQSCCEKWTHCATCKALCIGALRRGQSHRWCQSCTLSAIVWHGIRQGVPEQLSEFQYDVSIRGRAVWREAAWHGARTHARTQSVGG